VLEVQQTFYEQKWSVRVADEFSYTPESTYGYSVSSGLGTLSSSYAVSPDTAPNQTIQTASGTISETIATGVERRSDGRSSVSFNASYGLLHFTRPGFLDSDEIKLGTGYNYAFDRRNLMSLNYEFSQFGFNNAGTSDIDVHSVLLFYQRRMSRRLSFAASLGPQLTQYRPALGQAASFYGSGWIRYGLRKTELVASYSHSVTGGSGILPGATTDSAQLSLGHEAVRKWRGMLTLGYAHNKALSLGPQTANSQYNSGFLNLELNRSLRSGFWLYMMYNLQQSPLQCEPGVCNNDWRHIVGIGVRWQHKPIPIT
jgi:hypothetical protein